MPLLINSDNLLNAPVSPIFQLDFIGISHLTEGSKDNASRFKVLLLSTIKFEISTLGIGFLGSSEFKQPLR